MDSNHGRPITVTRRLDRSSEVVHDGSAQHGADDRIRTGILRFGIDNPRSIGPSPGKGGDRGNALPIELRLPCVWVTGVAPAASSSRTTRSSCLSYTQKKVPCQKARDGSSGCHTTRRPGASPGRSSTPPANRTLHASIWTRSSSQTAT